MCSDFHYDFFFGLTLFKSMLLNFQIYVLKDCYRLVLITLWSEWCFVCTSLLEFVEIFSSIQMWGECLINIHSILEKNFSKDVIFKIFVCFFWPCCGACGSQAPLSSGTAVKVLTPNHWATRGCPWNGLFWKVGSCKVLFLLMIFWWHGSFFLFTVRRFFFTVLPVNN